MRDSVQHVPDLVFPRPVQKIQVFSNVCVKGISNGWVTASLFFLDEGIRDFFAAVDGRDDDEEGAAGDDEAQLAVADVAFVVCVVC